jgi:DNA-binding transcriptional regulator YhcF (GntR family)
VTGEKIPTRPLTNGKIVLLYYLNSTIIQEVQRVKWQFSNDSPIYTQLVEQIQVGIATGAFPTGERLPSVRDLATEAGVNPNTMQRAMAELERDGLVYSQRTAGRYVTEDSALIQQTKRRLAQRHIQAFLAAMDRLGFDREEIISLLRQETEEDAEDGSSGM